MGEGEGIRCLTPLFAASPKTIRRCVQPHRLGLLLYSDHLLIYTFIQRHQFYMHSTYINRVYQTNIEARKKTTLVAASGGKTKEHLEGIVTIRPNVSSCSRPDREGQGHLHEPLETCQCSQHGNSDWKTVPQARKSNVLVDSGYSMPGGFTS